MKMKMIFSILLTLSIMSISSLTTAAKPEVCPGQVHFEAKIDNNVVNLARPYPGIPAAPLYLPYTMGVAAVKLTKGADEVKMKCSLLGEPTGLADPTYDHMIVCDDALQSELSFTTTMINHTETITEILQDSEIKNYCQIFEDIYYQNAFEELSAAPGTRPGKGLFNGAGGNLRVVGCTNVRTNGEININMGAEGCFDLPNWP